MAITGAVVFIPWLIVGAWLAPLPGSVQEQLDETIDLGLDGIIVYIDQAGKAPEFHAAAMTIPTRTIC